MWLGDGSPGAAMIRASHAVVVDRGHHLLFTTRTMDQLAPVIVGAAVLIIVVTGLYIGIQARRRRD